MSNMHPIFESILAPFAPKDDLTTSDLWMANRLDHLAEEAMVNARDAGTELATGVWIAEALAFRKVANSLRGRAQAEANREEFR